MGTNLIIGNVDSVEYINKYKELLTEYFDLFNTADVMRKAFPIILEQLDSHDDEGLINTYTYLCDWLDDNQHKLVDAAFPHYRNALTYEELSGVIEFYKTPLGEKVRAVIPVLTTRCHKAMMDVMVPVIKESLGSLGTNSE